MGGLSVGPSKSPSETVQLQEGALARWKPRKRFRTGAGLVGGEKPVPCFAHRPWSKSWGRITNLKPWKNTVGNYNLQMVYNWKEKWGCEQTLFSEHRFFLLFLSTWDDQKVFPSFWGWKKQQMLVNGCLNGCSSTKVSKCGIQYRNWLILIVVILGEDQIPMEEIQFVLIHKTYKTDWDPR